MSVFKKILSLLLAGGLFLVPVVAQDSKVGFNPGDYKGKDDILQSGSSSVDKLMVLEQELGITSEQWKSYYRGGKGLEFDIDSISEDSRRCILLGVKVADGVLALKAKDAETLNACAEYIEKLALELKVPKESLTRGFQIKDAVNRGDWFDAFFQLGLYRQDIVRALKEADGNDRSKAIMIVCGGWYHGASFAIEVMEDNYSGEITNYLRAQNFVSLMIAELETISRDDLKASNEMQYMLESLPKIREIVDLSRDWKIPEGQISKDRLIQLKILANGLVATALNGTKMPVR